MKNIIIMLISFIQTITLKFVPGVHSIRSVLLFFKIKNVDNSNKITFINSSSRKCEIVVSGKCNTISIKGDLVGSRIHIVGDRNSITIDSCSKLYNTNIILRGDDCLIEVGESTTFGRVYMVCMGRSNSIKIGKECMFAEDIDVWNSDSHPIFIDKNVINPSKPIVIGDKVWVGKGVKILKGVCVENNVVIGMGSIVTQNLRSGTLNVGSPSKSIKQNVQWDRNFIKI